MMQPRLGRGAGFVALAMALVALATIGCGGDLNSASPETRYTPESLATELVFRYKSLDPAHRNEASPKSKPRPTAQVKASPKSIGEANRDTRATTLDDLVRETLDKANQIVGTPHAGVIAQIAEAVTKDSALSEADRQIIADRLRAEGR